jgi:DegV family protein with EDD domain
VSQIHIIVDSCAQISKEMFETYSNLHSIPMKVRVGDQEWAEEDITSAELFKVAGEKKTHPQTSQPAPGEFIRVCKPLIDEGKEIIIITVSGGLSGTVEGARSVANMLDKNRIHVVDSGTASIGMLQMAKAALLMVDSGMKIQDILSKLYAIIESTHTLIIVDTLEYLYKGGRIGGAAALFGTILQIKPVIHLVDGKVAILDKVRTKQRAVKRVIDEIGKYKNFEYIGIGNVACPEEGEAIIKTVTELYPEVQVLPAAIGSALGTHLGAGMIGIILQEKI